MFNPSVPFSAVVKESLTTVADWKYSTSGQTLFYLFQQRSVLSVFVNKDRSYGTVMVRGEQVKSLVSNSLNVHSDRRSS